MRKFVALPIERPVATAMFFIGIAILGLVGWARIPIELLPELSGDQLFVRFSRQGSEPHVVEREMLDPLEAAAAALSGVTETNGRIQGATGTLTLEFGRDTDHRVRELELTQIAAAINRDQPQGSFINVSAQDSSILSRLVMLVQVVGGTDADVLRDLVEERIRTRLLAVPGVSQAIATGGAARGVNVWLDADRASASGLHAAQVTAALNRSVRQLSFVGGVESGSNRQPVMVDGRPASVAALGELRIDPASPVLLRHVAQVELGTQRRDSVFRVNGQAAVGVVLFQEEGENLVQLGRNVRRALEQLREEFGPLGIEFTIGFDAAQTVEDQLSRLKQLAISGFLIALAVLYLFLREWRAVAVVAVAVPVSLLAAGAMLYLGGFSLNLITLFGFAVGVGILVDNSIVVYEAVQRGLERGNSPTDAAINGIRRTLRAILASCATTAVVFLPGIYVTEDPLAREIILLVAVTILLPLAASLLVAAGLVPLLAQRLAAPAAAARLQRVADERAAFAGLNPPQRARDAFTGLLKVALRNPMPWLAGVAASVLFTVIVALPWVLIGTLTQQAREADQVQIEVEFTASRSLESGGEIFARLERAAMALPGVERVESTFNEEDGTLSVHLVDADERPKDATAGRVRAAMDRAVGSADGVALRQVSSVGGASDDDALQQFFGGGDSEVLLSGPDMGHLQRIATEIAERLRSIPEIGEASVGRTAGRDELQIRPNLIALTDYGLNSEVVFDALGVMSREGIPLQSGFVLDSGREIPIQIQATHQQVRGHATVRPVVGRVENLLIPTTEGVVAAGVLASAEKRLPQQVISHRNGRRELRVTYRLRDDVPSSGPARAALEARIQDAVRSSYRPSGYAIEASGLQESTSWFKTLALPALLLLYAVLAIAFESLTLPLLILLAVPLTVLGATWALVFAGMPAGPMALIGAITLLGVTVNPAILLVDRMQSRIRVSAFSHAAAAMAAVKERTRPVLMTSCTTIAGLWPLAIATGREFEIWPPFATVMIGGLVTSTVLTLLVIPVGFVFLARLDELLARLGPWRLLSWLAATVLIVYAAIATGLVTSLTWQIIGALAIATILLVAARQSLPRLPLPMPTEPMELEVRYLSKIYGAPGPVMKAWHLGAGFAAKVLARGGRPVSARRAREQALALALLAAGAAYLAIHLQTMFWRLIFAFLAVALINGMTTQLQRYAGQCDALGRVSVDGAWAALRLALPWIALGSLSFYHFLLPSIEGTAWGLHPIVITLCAVLILVVQLGRRTAVKITAGQLSSKADQGRAQALRTGWRGASHRFFGLDLPRRSVAALSGVDFRIAPGMVGILGPNGAGKTTLLRLLAGVLTPSAGTIRYGGVRLNELRSRLANWVGYLPQEFGLPSHLTAREYLDYFAALYDVGDRDERERRVAKLLADVGLAERSADPISGFSGGMRQRVGVARALLREPPVIIVDEPTVGLDPRERIRFRNLLTKLAAQRVVLFSTHVVEDVAVSCPRVIVMHAGRVAYDGDPAGLAQRCAGAVWEVTVADDAAQLTQAQLTHSARVIDRAPQGDGRTRLRILCTTQPCADAVAVEPTLEDGYLNLLGRDARISQARAS